MEEYEVSCYPDCATDCVTLKTPLPLSELCFLTCALETVLQASQGGCEDHICGRGIELEGRSVHPGDFLLFFLSLLDPVQFRRESG